MSLYADYLKERSNREIIEDDKGFATFYINGDTAYIEDIFVKKEYRKSGAASNYADQIVVIAKERQCKKLYGTVIPSANNSTISLKVLLGYGFELDNCLNNIIVLKKDI